MARYVKDVTLNKPDDFVAFIMNDYLQKNAFAMSDWKGEPCYRAGDAMMEGFKYLKWNYYGGILHLEAWLKGNFGKEMHLEGFVGALVKKPYRESLEQLLTVLQQELPEAQMNATAEGSQPTAQPIQVATVNNTNAATLALLFGILALVLAFVSPIFSIICACLGFAQARMGAGSTAAGKAKTGKILSIIGLVLAILMWVIGIVLNVLLMM